MWNGTNYTLLFPPTMYSRNKIMPQCLNAEKSVKKSFDYLKFIACSIILWHSVNLQG